MAERSVLSVHTNPETAERLNRLATARQQKKSALANQAIEEFLAKEELIEARIREGLEDAAAGRTLSNETILEWADSLGTDAPKPLPQA
ncbi:hypothetical protein GTA62_17585 [Roseobacter sp. HKCCD9010]|uniref:CopG family ribbon-helix-helix protein n=1 Tax=unclassified Roseobacter TaxID=196798 RepID=UPI001491DD41|nr:MULTISPECIES: hypothetical protein [unclassified Roseobacter]MBF9051883.1 hypothetical protein [Rhodobacterales bacterium HKCCD4356]NNV13876.1 hypothetical protein [Roseobacter sp. HKCCD7357]NNV17901.1 hypothetical protein [Roseobacter sp. HKCCD8768]NNV27508.1 hypothetical protein [Roseobacter sp. HKCCD8192]NNV31628.1 hypothetical protein [Roseobacter sp. HKCCD9061]